MKASTKFLIFFAAVALLMLLAQLFKPQPINWRLTFSKNDKIPYGNYALFSLLPEIFPHSVIEFSEEPIYNFTKNKKYNKSSYIIITENFQLDTLDRASLFNFVSEGNSAFIAAESFDLLFKDTLGFSTTFLLSALSELNDTCRLSLLNPIFDTAQHFSFQTAAAHYYFSLFDSTRTIALGKNSENYLTFISVSFGKGKFFISTTPKIFTNYYFLNTNSMPYITDALSYLSDGVIIWDDYYNSGRTWAQTPLRFILSNKSLRIAWYIILIGIILFIVFRAKRRQRIIPIIKPPANDTLEFAKTIGRLYYEQKNNRIIAEKRILYLIDFIRMRFNISVSEFDDDVLKRLIEKTEIDRKIIEDLFASIRQALSNKEVNDETIMILNQRIENFYELI